jgi:hypothetical protein
MTSGEAVTLLGANMDASWLWVQPSAYTLQCWAAAFFLSLPTPLPPLAVITPSSPPAELLPLQSTAEPTKKARPRPPRPTSSATEPPNPYPYPSP